MFWIKFGIVVGTFILFGLMLCGISYAIYKFKYGEDKQTSLNKSLTMTGFIMLAVIVVVILAALGIDLV